MHTGQPNSLLLEITDDLQMVILNDGVIITTVHKEQDRISIVKAAGSLGQPAGMDGRLYAWSSIQAILQQESARVEFMSSWSVAGFAATSTMFLTASRLSRIFLN